MGCFVGQRQRLRRRARALVAVALLGAAACDETPVRENLVLITVDTLRADAIGPYGGSVATPALDRLAREGVVVEGACTPIPSTAPAHASLFSGLHPWRHGLLENGVRFEAGRHPSLSSLLAESGLVTAAFVSSYVLHSRWGFDHGFGHYHFQPNEPGLWGDGQGFSTRGALTTDAALRWIASHRDVPFFVWIHFFDPHDPYQPPEEFLETGPLETPAVMRDGPSRPRAAEALARQIRAYRGEVAYSDAQIGRLLDGLEGLALLDRTAIVFTADHGEGLGQHQALRHGTNLFDEAVVVPLIIRAPGLPRGVRLRGAAQLEDLMPTLLSLQGVAPPEAIDGVDLLGWLKGERESSPRASVVGRRRRKETPLFFERRWPEKWIGDADGSGIRYRLDDDPHERSGVKSPELPASLHAHLAGELAIPQERALDDEARRGLEALGYLEQP
jgi:arylsulfatase A-like enzyme